MKCQDCKNKIEEELKYLAYYCNGKPVYWNICEKCIKKKWLAYKASHAFLSLNATTENKYRLD